MERCTFNEALLATVLLMATSHPEVQSARAWCMKLAHCNWQQQGYNTQMLSACFCVCEQKASFNKTGTCGPFGTRSAYKRVLYNFWITKAVAVIKESHITHTLLQRCHGNVCIGVAVHCRRWANGVSLQHDALVVNWSKSELQSGVRTSHSFNRTLLT